MSQDTARRAEDLGLHGDPEAIWRPWTAGELRSHLIHSGHHQAEQAPDELASALLRFLGPEKAGYGQNPRFGQSL
jgi:hypothetical protein